MIKINHLLMAGVLAMASVLGITACSSTPVQESAGQYLDSTTVTAQVKAALLNTPNLNSGHISVETYKGTVQLSGFVDSQAQSNLAESVAKDVPGVNRIKNDLIVKTD